MTAKRREAGTAQRPAGAPERRRPRRAPAGRRLYVYYRVPAVAQAEVVTVVRAMQAALRGQRPELVAELWRRPPQADGDVTLMEVYSAPGGVDETQQAAIAAAATALSGPAGRAERHVEVFEACS